MATEGRLWQDPHVSVFRTIYERFDPEGAPPSEWRADRSRSPTKDILDRLRLGIGAGRFLVVGTVGTGKSTELLRIAEGRARESFVVQLDLVSHFDRAVGNLTALQRVTSWEVVFLSAIAIARAAQERLGLELVDGALSDLEAAWKRAAKKSGVPGSTTATINLTKLAKSMAILASAVGGGPAGAEAAKTLLAPLDAADVKWKLPVGRSVRRLDDQDDEVQTLLQAANVIINDVQYRHGRRVLLVLDGLDRIEGHDEAGGLFLGSSILSQLQCQSVVCGPFILRHDAGLSTVRGFDIEVLVNEPVIDFDDPGSPGPGVEFMLEVFARRTADLAVEVPEAIVREVAHRSGGRVRDFVKLVRELAAQVLLDEAGSVTEAHLATALKKQRLLLETGLTKNHLDVLRAVMADPHRSYPAGEIGYELLRTSKLLPYPNGSAWYYPHSLLLRGNLLT